MWRAFIDAATCTSDLSERTARLRSDCSHGSRHERPAEQAMSGREPTLDDILSDPIVLALMRADGVEVLELTAMLSRVNHHRSAARQNEQLLKVD